MTTGVSEGVDEKSEWWEAQVNQNKRRVTYQINSDQVKMARGVHELLVDMGAIPVYIKKNEFYTLK